MREKGFDTSPTWIPCTEGHASPALTAFAESPASWAGRLHAAESRKIGLHASRPEVSGDIEDGTWQDRVGRQPVIAPSRRHIGRTT